MKSFRLISIFILLFLVAATVVPGLQAQVCPYGNTGGSGSGGVTLLTITLDGNSADWAPVLANSLQVTHEGEFRNPCSTTPPVDLDCTRWGYRNVSGRDLAGFAWTYDTQNIYFYLKRYGSTSNQMSFFFFVDSNQNQRMNTGETVLSVTMQGGSAAATLYTYTAQGGIYGDASGDYMAEPSVAPYVGYADGYTIGGSKNNAIGTPSTPITPSPVPFTDGTGFEAALPWSSLGVSAGTGLYFHVASKGGNGASTAGVDDNCGGPDGKNGYFAYHSVWVTPDFTSSVAPDQVPPLDSVVTSYLHTVTNKGTFPDRYILTDSSTLGLKVELIDESTSTVFATDSNGDGVFDPGSVLADYDSNGDNVPDIPKRTGGVFPDMIPGGTFQVGVRITVPVGVDHTQDVTTLSAFSQYESGLCASARDTTAIGTLTLTPTPQAKAVAAGQTVDYGLTLGNHSGVSEVFDLRITSSQGWRVELYDGTTLVATDDTGDGNWDWILIQAPPPTPPLYDTNVNGRPDFGSLADTGTQAFIVRLTAPSSPAPPVGTIDTATVLAQGATYGASTTAVLTTTVRDRLTFTPSYTVASGTNKYSGQGVSVFYAHTLINSWPASETVTLGSTQTPVTWSILYWTDPNGDGNPEDGTPITAPFTLAGNGGNMNLVVQVVIPTGLTLPYTHSATVTATGAGTTPPTAAVTDEVIVSYLATYADYGRTISQRVFSRCQTLYAKGAGLTASTGYTFNYINPSATVVRSQAVTSDANAIAIDQYTFTSTDAEGTWTLELRLTSTNALQANMLFYVDPPPASPASVNPVTTDQASYALTGDNLSITATFNNPSVEANFVGTTFRYLVRDPGLTQYLKDDGTFATYNGNELTRTTTPHTVLASSSATETVTVNGVTFPSAGLYRLDVTWMGSCGNTIASATLYIPVGTTLASYADSMHLIPEECFLPGSTVNLWGSFYLLNTAYQVAYYPPGGTSTLVQAVTSTGAGELSTDASASALGTPGTWDAVVYPSGVTPPPVLYSADPKAMAADVFFVAPAAPTAGNDGPICAGSTLNLTASTIAGVTYSWTGPNGFTSSAQNPSIPSATAAASGTYYVTATINGCTSAAGSTAVTVNAIPVATITAASPVCASSTGNTASVAGGVDTYVWSITNGTITDGDGTSTITYTAGTTGPVNFEVTVTKAGCSNTDSASVAVNAIPATPTAINNGPVCAGATLYLYASTLSGATYSWTGPNGFSSSLQNPSIPNATVAASGQYSVTATVDGCTSSAGTTTAAVNAASVTPNFVSALPVPDVEGAAAQQILTLTNPAGSSMPSSFAFTWDANFIVHGFGASSPGVPLGFWQEMRPYGTPFLPTAFYPIIWSGSTSAFVDVNANGTYDPSTDYAVNLSGHTVTVSRTVSPGAVEIETVGYRLILQSTIIQNPLTGNYAVAAVLSMSCGSWNASTSESIQPGGSGCAPGELLDVGNAVRVTKSGTGSHFIISWDGAPDPDPRTCMVGYGVFASTDCTRWEAWGPFAAVEKTQVELAPAHTGLNVLYLLVAEMGDNGQMGPIDENYGH